MRSRALSAFTVIELLVAVSIMTVIVFGLYQIFNRTQRALRGNITQVDVMESGRAAVEMISRELEQLSACELLDGTNLVATMLLTSAQKVPPYRPFVQLDLDEKTPLRTNVLSALYFLNRSNNVFVGRGYWVVGASNGVGTLYRFSTNVHERFLTSTNLSGDFVRAVETAADALQRRDFRVFNQYFNRVADGIVHLRLRAVDDRGRTMLAYGTNTHPSYVVRWPDSPQQGLQPVPNNAWPNVILRRELAVETGAIFLSNALPAYVELEVGVIEPETLSRYSALRVGSGSAAENFLKKQANKVHLFRRRIPIRTATQ